ncbi:MAG: hypothetical protein ACRD3D_13105 [Terriglobia bacterium]
MHFKIVSPLEGVETIAVGGSIRSLPRLRKHYGKGRWRKLKGFAKVKLRDGTIAKAELHWYEAHGIGKREVRLIRLLS